MKTYETVIGLEVHLQFNTNTKIFCGCANKFGQDPNTQTCPVCLGLPGALPVLNKTALYHAIKVAVAFNCQVNPYIKFDRKNYYYPDLPKGYQISQYDLPIANQGFLNVKTGNELKKISIKRAHLEEDAGKLIHDETLGASLVDYNRTGTPLMEIVSDPDMRSPQEAYDYLTTLKLTLEYLNVSDCDMEKGSLRCDANVSLREKGAKKFGAKVEIKNMNSFKAVKSALEFEEIRQRKLLESGERIPQETRLWNDAKNITISMRSKEEAHDYRYFPEPDLVPFTVNKEIIEEIRCSLPESPQAKLSRFIQGFSLSDYDAGILIQDRALADLFEECASVAQGQKVSVKKIANWIIGPLMQELNSRKIDVASARKKSGQFTEQFLNLISKVESGALSNLGGKEILGAFIDSGESIEQLISKKGLAQVSDESALEQIADEAIRENPEVVSQIKSGKESAIGFLVGQSMKKSKGKGNPKILGDIIKRRLQNV